MTCVQSTAAAPPTAFYFHHARGSIHFTLIIYFHGGILHPQNQTNASPPKNTGVTAAHYSVFGIDHHDHHPYVTMDGTCVLANLL